MDVEFDPAKDRVNKRKHGLSLGRAEDFDRTTAVIRMDDREDYGEDRFNAIGFLDSYLCVLTFTLRGKTLRAISLHKSEPEERRDYAKNF